MRILSEIKPERGDSLEYRFGGLCSMMIAILINPINHQLSWWSKLCFAGWELYESLARSL
jgi:hypothetical protein